MDELIYMASQAVETFLDGDAELTQDPDGQFVVIERDNEVRGIVFRDEDEIFLRCDAC